MGKPQFSAPIRTAKGRRSVVFIDRFSSLDELNGKDRHDRKKILAVLARVGKFSCFEIDNAMASAMTWLCNQSGWITTKHSEIVKDDDGHGSHERSLYPWTFVTLTDAGRKALAESQ